MKNKGLQGYQHGVCEKPFIRCAQGQGQKGQSCVIVNHKTLTFMKKSILFLALALLMSIDYATAQKQVGSDKNVEFTFAPLGGNPIGIQGIRLRSFNSDGTGAIRLGCIESRRALVATRAIDGDHAHRREEGACLP